MPEAQKRTWCSPIYSFFKEDVKIDYIDGRLCYFFPCTARKCKATIGGVRQFQHLKDKSSTENLRHHARRCFGDEVVKRVTCGNNAVEQSSSIFAVFARKGQQPVRPSNRPHSNMEVRAYNDY
jgi:hypothetical protein